MEHRSLNLKAADRAAGFDENQLLFDPHTYKMSVAAGTQFANTYDAQGLLLRQRQLVCGYSRPRGNVHLCGAAQLSTCLFCKSSSTRSIVIVIFFKNAKNHELSNCASFLQRNMELIKELI